jgi:putative redox protein
MRTVHVDWLGDLMFDGSDSKGMPVDIDGRSSRGAKPSDLLPLALGSCSGYDVVKALETKGELRGVSIAVSYTQQPDPPWTFQRFKMHYTVTGSGFTEETVAAAIQESVEHQCSVAATVKATATIETSFELTIG